MHMYNTYVCYMYVKLVFDKMNWWLIKINTMKVKELIIIAKDSII